MNMPFTTEQFFQVFRDYNLSVWPMQVIFNLLAVIVIYLVIKKNKLSDRTISGILGFFWLWIGIVYHLIFFTAINKAAYIFGVLYIIQGLLFLYYGFVKQIFSFGYKSDFYGIAGVIFILFALIIYPLTGYFAGHIFPYNPTFGLPCPTTIFTFGILLWNERKIPFYVMIIPLIWSVIGFFAALNFSVYEDTGLLIAGVTGFGMILFRVKAQRR